MKFGPVFVLASLLLVSCGDDPPAISYIDPPIGIPGQMILIHGENFGGAQAESYVTIAGSSPSSSAYLEWKDDLIRLKVPAFAESGMVYVHIGEKRSNGALYSTQTTIPRLKQSSESGLEPRVSSITPEKAPVGSLVTITGNGFGASRDRGAVFFAWASEIPPSAPAEERQDQRIEVFDDEGGYESWGEREIRVRVPDGAVSGSIIVKTPRGDSRPVYFEVTAGPGTRTFKDRRSYTISNSVDIRVSGAERPNTLYLWVPQPARSASQREFSLMGRSQEPFVESYQGASLYRLQDLEEGQSVSISQNFLVDVYAQETAVKVQLVKQDTSSPVYRRCTANEELIPCDDVDLKNQAKTIAGREKNPYLIARNIYQWMIKEVRMSPRPSRAGVTDALRDKAADSWQAAFLFCALARAAGVPALPDAGVLVTRNRSAIRHYWAEFWIEGLGWVPVDPLLGSGAAPDNFQIREDYAEYYFGGMDNQRILFSRGVKNLSRMAPNGRPVLRSRDYALQSFWEEAVGALSSYSSLWGDVTVTGMYAR